MPPQSLQHAARSGVPTKASPRATLRLVGAGVAAACWGVLGLAWSVSPSPAGYGTHEQLHLPPCSLLVRTGYPCPTCGLTTSMAAMARGRVLAAVRAQPFGPALFAGLAALAAAGTVQLLTGRPAIAKLRVRWWWAPAALAGLLAGWGAAVLAGIAAGRLPVR